MYAKQSASYPGSSEIRNVSKYNLPVIQCCPRNVKSLARKVFTLLEPRHTVCFGIYRPWQVKSRDPLQHNFYKKKEKHAVLESV